MYGFLGNSDWQPEAGVPPYFDGKRVGFCGREGFRGALQCGSWWLGWLVMGVMRARVLQCLRKCGSFCGVFFCVCGLHHLALALAWSSDLCAAASVTGITGACLEWRRVRDEGTIALGKSCYFCAFHSKSVCRCGAETLPTQRVVEANAVLYV